ncbi:MAG: SPOR domain-containing protein [Caldicoprobacterales bacterium]|jgi:hypothetical protein|nr:SPOR domain-containing protein [Clostridiales bacterium]
MRYSRIRKRQARKRYTTLILIILLGFSIVYIFSAGQLGKLVSNLLLSVINGESKGEESKTDYDDPVLTVPENTEEPARDTVKVTETLKTNALTIYAIQMGAFTDGSNAEAFAQELRNKGGAGYILDDGFYRVMAIGFQSEEDAQKVRKGLKDDDIEAHVYKMAASGVNMEITATKDNVAAISSAYESWEKNYRSLEDIIVSLDSGSVSPIEASDRIRAIKTEMGQMKNQLQEISSNQSNNAILSGLAALYDSSCQSLDKVLSKNVDDKVAISSVIKYTYIDMFMQYKDYMEQITK